MIADVEAAIASRWYRKDPRLQIAGLPKERIASICGFQVFQVSSEWIRDNLDTTFGTGGHGLVHSFIPLNELWVDPVTEGMPSLIFHEAIEFFYMMQHNQSYWDAHNNSLEDQIRLNLTMDNVASAIHSVIAEAPPSRQEHEPSGKYFVRLAARQHGHSRTH